ncbi:MAG TPA: hypothetical protein PK781_03835 [Terrimesophilobacter sp.]|nr:hypothetical protein [Terrimesophilobacter sp.]HRP99574.1 hypothetical protein [Terrimesophilobacter sp.]
MSDISDASAPHGVPPDLPGGRRSPAHTLLVLLLGAETLLLAGAALFLLWELVVEVPTSYATAVAMLVLVAVAAVWLAFVTLAVWNGRPWSRGAALFWQLVQVAIAVGSFQGVFARPDIGWFLLVPAVLVIVLLFTRSVLRATARRD